MANKLTLQTIFSAIDRISGPTKTITTKMQRLGQVSAQVGKAMAVVGAAGAAAGLAIGKAAIAFAERGDDIARNAGILGLTASAYQELSYAANMADIEQEAFASATKKLNATLGQLQRGEGTLYTTLKRTNPALAKQLRTAKSTDDAFNLVAGAISKEANAQARAALAVAAFGKSGQDLIPMLEDLAKLRAEAQASGTIIPDDQIKSAEKFDDALKRLKATGLSLANTALAQVSEKLATLAARATEWMQANREIIGQKIEATINAVGKALEIATAPGVLSGLAALAVAIKSVGIATSIFGAGNPMVATIAAISALITLIVTNWDKITGFFDRMNQGQRGAAAAAMAEWGVTAPPESPSPVSLAPAQAVPLSPSSGPASPVSRSELAVNFSNLPAGTTTKQTGKAPGISVNLGATMPSGGAH